MLERPLRKIETALGCRSEQADRLAGMKRLDAGGDDDIAGIETMRDDDRARIEAQQFDIAQRDGQLLGSTIQTAGWRLSSVRAEAGMAITVSDPAAAAGHRRHRAASPPADRSSPTLTSKVRVTGSACGATSRTRPVAVTVGIVGQAAP